MLNGLSTTRRRQSPWALHAVFGCLSASLALLLLPPQPAGAQPPAKTDPKTKPAAPKTEDAGDDDTPKTKAAAAARCQGQGRFRRR